MDRQRTLALGAPSLLVVVVPGVHDFLRCATYDVVRDDTTEIKSNGRGGAVKFRDDKIRPADTPELLVRRTLAARSSMTFRIPR